MAPGKSVWFQIADSSFFSQVKFLVLNFKHQSVVAFYIANNLCHSFKQGTSYNRGRQTGLQFTYGLTIAWVWTSENVFFVITNCCKVWRLLLSCCGRRLMSLTRAAHSSTLNTSQLRILKAISFCACVKQKRTDCWPFPLELIWTRVQGNCRLVYSFAPIPTCRFC